MTLPVTKAKSYKERRDEIAEIKDDEFFRISSYRDYDSLKDLKPYKGKSENIRFFVDGLEILVDAKSSHRLIGGKGQIEYSNINTTFCFQLIDEKNKKILEYEVDAQEGEF